MMNSLRRLADIGSAAIRGAPLDETALVSAMGSDELESLVPLLRMRNGFYAFEGALHVLSDLGTSMEPGLIQWNEAGLWRHAYEGLAENCVFFGEDVFGVQFALRGREIFTFDPETGAFKEMARCLDDWATRILEDHALWTGFGIAHEWQARHGRLPAGSRLIPIVPFVLGGSYEVGNVHAIDAAKGMNYRAAIAKQIEDMPDGTSIKLTVVP